MRLTKLEHAALSIEKSGSRLFIDPGKFTTPITEAAGTVAIVITHEHDDHWTSEQLTRILARNPKTPIFTTTSAAEKILAANLPDIGEVIDVAAGESVLVGGFDLEFFGGEHAIIHSSIPRIENIGVLVEHGALYYGGDAYVAPEGVELLLDQRLERCAVIGRRFGLGWSDGARGDRRGDHDGREEGRDAHRDLLGRQRRISN